MTVALGAHVQGLLPQRLLCRCVYRLARTRAPWVKAPLIAWFRRHYGIDMAEAEPERAGEYATFNDFFTRALKPGARIVAGGADRIVAPSDGTLTEFGTLERDRMLQAKGMSYALPALLGEDSDAVTRFIDGHYATIYLAPHNYHRVHVPAAGALVRARYIPGDRYSVNHATVSAIAGLFCRNERVVCWLECGFGPLVVVLVGALNVSSISLTTHGEIASGPAREWREPVPVPFAKGAELARFNLGSTVVVLFPAGAIQWKDGLRSGHTLIMGAEIARTVARSA
jgi:phosphatidylserine decarboxylase